MSCGYADVNGIKLYHEISGQGEPLVLIHGGLTTIGEMQGWVQPLAKTRRVIAVEMQGHGRTADTDRTMSFATMGDDIAALLNHLQIPKADVVGHSFGGAIAIRTATQHPDKVRRLVVISSPHARSAWYPETQEGMSQVGAGLAENMMQTPTGKFSKQWAEPQRFPRFLDKMGKMMSEDYDWSADIAKLPMPVLLVFADNDSVSQKHIAEFFALLGGGVKEPGWLNTRLSKSRLAVVPGYRHYNFISSPEVAQIVGKFLADPLTNPPNGAAAASQVAPAPEKTQWPGSETRGERRSDRSASAPPRDLTASMSGLGKNIAHGPDARVLFGPLHSSPRHECNRPYTTAIHQLHPINSVLPGFSSVFRLLDSNGAAGSKFPSRAQGCPSTRYF